MPRPFSSKKDSTETLKRYIFSETLLQEKSIADNEMTLPTGDVLLEAVDTMVNEKDVEEVDVKSNTFDRTRRRALADIFENVDAGDMASLLSLYIRREISALVHRNQLHRRGGKPDIFEGVSNDEIQNVFNSIEGEHIANDSQESCDSELVCDTMDKLNTPRRGGKSDIFEGMSLDERREMKRLYDLYQQHVRDDGKSCCEADVNDSTQTHDFTCGTAQSSRPRRGGKFDIFEGLSEEEMLHIRHLHIETSCNGLNELQVGYGR